MQWTKLNRSLKRGISEVVYALIDILVQGKESIVKIATQIANLEEQCGLNASVEDTLNLNELHFGLVEVVYEWACGKVCMYDIL